MALTSSYNQSIAPAGRSSNIVRGLIDFQHQERLRRRGMSNPQLYDDVAVQNNEGNVTGNWSEVSPGMSSKLSPRGSAAIHAFLGWQLLRPCSLAIRAQSMTQCLHRS